MTVLSAEDLQKAIDLLSPPLYYAMDGNLERGVVYFISETKLNPDFILFHPDDFDAIKGKITNRKLVNIKDEPLADSLKRWTAK